MRYYLGYKSGQRELFRANAIPTVQSHGHLYAAVTGPFRTKRGAIFMRDYGNNNPHCRCVSEAEKLAKKYAA
jgi:hypothetical protein